MRRRNVTWKDAIPILHPEKKHNGSYMKRNFILVPTCASH